MSRYVAFLRGIPVGRSGVSTDALRKIFERLAFSDVEVLFTTGNVGFVSDVGNLPPLEAQISRALFKALGYKVWTFIRTAREISEVAEYQPFSAEDAEEPGNSLFVVLLPTAPEERLQRQLRAMRTEADDFRVVGREIYWLRRTEAAAAGLSVPQLGRVLASPATVRAHNTIRRIAERYGSKPLTVNR